MKYLKLTLIKNMADIIFYIMDGRNSDEIDTIVKDRETEINELETSLNRPKFDKFNLKLQGLHKDTNLVTV